MASKPTASVKAECDRRHFATTAEAERAQILLSEMGYVAPVRQWDSKCKAFHIQHGGKR